MTNTEIWDITKRWKREAIQKKLFTCVSNIMSPDYFSQLFNKNFRNMIYSDRPKISYKETKEDLLLAFDIFSYMTFCQNDAMELQLFYETLLRTGSTQSIVKATLSNLKLTYEEKSTETALQHIYEELDSLIDLKLSQILVAMYDSTITEMPFVSQKNEDSKLNVTEMSVAAKLSTHPVSIYEENNKMSPSAFIPFCSFGAEMMGSEVPNMTFPICDIFEPTVFEGKLCYQVDVEKTSGQRVFEGKESGLMLLIDSNVERSIGITTSQESNNPSYSKRRVFLGHDKVISNNLASIHIGTLAMYTGHGPGDYALTAIKEMTGTENFLAWPEHKRGCMHEKYEKCQMKGFLEESKRCGCSPFQSLSATGNTDQVHSR